MKSQLSSFTISGVTLLLMFSPSIAVADEAREVQSNESFMVFEQARSHDQEPLILAEKGEDKNADKKPKPCDPGLPCQKHSSTAADIAEDGTACPTGGYACNQPGVQHCGTNDGGTCYTQKKPARTGPCGCYCVIPQ